MLSLGANTSPVYARPFIRTEYLTDGFGNETGETENIYGNIARFDLCVGLNRTSETVYMFGTFADYDRTITTSNTSVPITENSILWVDYGIVENYSTIKNYAIGDKCIYGGAMYTCISPVTASAWNATKWKEEKHNFIVKKRAPWKNSIAYAIKEVDVG